MLSRITKLCFIWIATYSVQAHDHENTKDCNLLNPFVGHLASETITHILDYLPEADLASAALTSSRLKVISQGELKRRLKKQAVSYRPFTLETLNKLFAYLSYAQLHQIPVNICLNTADINTWRNLGDLSNMVSALRVEQAELFQATPKPRVNPIARLLALSPMAEAQMLRMQSISVAYKLGGLEAHKEALEKPAEYYLPKPPEKQPGSPQFFDDELSLRTLTRLGIVNCAMKSGAFLDLPWQTALKHIKHLDISGNPMDFYTGLFSDFQDKMVTLIYRGLLSLNISGIKTPKKLIYSLEDMENKYQLESLVMDETDHEMNALRVLLQSKKFPNLTHLSIRKSDIKTQYLPDTLRLGLAGLHHLDLSGNLLNEDGIDRALKLCPWGNLTSLDFSGNPGATREFIDELKLSYPFIKG